MQKFKIEEVGYNSFIMTPTKWKKRTNCIGIIPSSGRYSKGTFAHPDIALEFASWIDTGFKLYLIKEFERLKVNEAYLNKKWRKNNPNLKGNIRDNTDITHLIVLNNLEVLNSNMISEGINQIDRIDKLNKEAIKQLTILYENNNIKKIDTQTI